MNIDTVKVQIYMPDGSARPIVHVSKRCPIREILVNCIEQNLSEDIVLFSGTPNASYATPIINFDATIEDLNMYHRDFDYIAEFSIHHKSDTASYNHERYAMYSGIS